VLGAGTGAFAGPTNYPVGINPRAIAVGDFRGIGKSDLAVANTGSNNVSILLGAGGGAFGPSTAFNAGISPYDIAVGDFNNDHKQDLVVANDNVAVSVLLGNGNGTFQSPITDADPGIAPSSVTVADFNKDGKLDVAVANAVLGTVSVLLGNGDGTFKPAIITNLPPGARPVFIASGKFNESSGNTDVAVTDIYGNGTVYVLLGLGNGHFSPATAYPVSLVPVRMAVGDLNGDGHQDLLVTNSYGFNISILTGDGAGHFKNAVNYSTPTMWEPVRLRSGDSMNRPTKPTPP
jgi:hypothetical protein